MSTGFIQRLEAIASRNGVVYVILFAYVIFACWISNVDPGNDCGTYYGYFEGWKLGRYTYWYDIKDYIPDTFRNPGFPALVGLISLLSKKIWVFQVFQYILTCITIVLSVKLIQRYSQSAFPVWVFALLLVLNPVIPVYVILVVPETTTGFLLILILYVRVFFAESWKKYLLVGVLFAILFQVRPIVLFLPFILFVSDWWLQEKRFSVFKNISILVIYIVSMLPYGYWNYKTHGIFSVTSIEGGGGVLHLGYWSLKMPGYTEKRYWNNGTDKALINFVSDKDIPANIRAFDKEWDIIDSSCAQYLTDKDLRNMAYMKADGARFVTYNGRYTYEREKLLKKFAFKHYCEDWTYTIKIKIYTFFRLWITGVSKDALEQASSFDKIKILLTAITAGFTFLLALLFIPVALYKRKLRLSYWLPIIVTVVYWGSIHIPFAIQSRYTIPVRLLLIALTAVSIYELFFNKELKKEN